MLRFLSFIVAIVVAVVIFVAVVRIVVADHLVLFVVNTWSLLL